MSASQEAVAKANGVPVEEVDCENCAYYIDSWKLESPGYPFPWCRFFSNSLTGRGSYCSFWEMGVKNET